MIIVRDTFPTAQTSNQKWNLSATTIASSVDNLSETDNKVFNAMVVTVGIIGRSSQTLFQCSSLLLIAKPVALSIRCCTGLRAKSFYSCSFPMHVVQIANHQYHPLLGCGCLDFVATSISESDDSSFWNPFFFSVAFFQLENPFFVNTGSALDEVSIALWIAFKQVWQQPASLLSSWCNHIKRSNNAIWCLKLFFSWILTPEDLWNFSAGMDHLIRLQRLDLEDWVVTLSFPVCQLLLWMAPNLLHLFFGSDCFFDYTRLCVTTAWF